MVHPDGSHAGTWPPIACTLIHGPTSAVLVNAPFTTAVTAALADWMSGPLSDQQSLTGVYISHGLGDYFFGLPVLRTRFPGLKVYCTRTTLQAMRESVTPGAFEVFAARFPVGQIPDQPAVADVVAEVQVLPDSNELTLDGHALHAITVGQGAVADSTVLWVPSLRLVVCGTVVYGSGHPMLAFCPTQALREAYIASIEMIEALEPASVVCGHQKEGEVAGVWHLRRCREYIETFGELVETGGVKTAEELVDVMKERYPGWFNVDALVMGARAAFGEASVVH